MKRHSRVTVGLLIVGSAMGAAGLGAPGIATQVVSAQDCSGTSVGLKPLPELGGETWLGYSGGLYGDGANSAPPHHRDSADALGRDAAPLDVDGAPDPSGRVVLLSIGMSNATQEFSEFVRIASADAQISDDVLIVDGAQGGQTAADIKDPSARFWEVVDARLDQAGASGNQVQFVWLKEANRQPSGPADEHAAQLRDDLADVVRILHDRFPNLRIVYLSSRIYAGYATTTLNPEPYAYASGFAVKWLIADQIAGQADLNWKSARGPAEAPLLLWGPYLWADGLTARASDGLTWECDDYVADGTHPGPDGRYKVATLLLDFFKTDQSARVWFLTDPEATAEPSPTQASGVPTTPAGGDRPVRLRLRETPSNDEFWLETRNPIVLRRAETLTSMRPAWLCSNVIIDSAHEWGFRFDGGQARLERQSLPGRETTVRQISAEPGSFTGQPACVQVDRLIDTVPIEPTTQTPEATPSSGTREPTAGSPSSTLEPTSPHANDDSRLFLPFATVGTR